MRSVRFVINPASGQDDPDRTEHAVVERLGEDGVDVEVLRTEGEGDARRWAAEAGGTGVDALVVAGGDGTLREAVSGLVAGEADVPLGIVPTGTANLLAGALGVPEGDPRAAAAVVVDSRERSLDVLHLVDRDEHAVLMVDAGFDARLVRDASRGRKDLLGHAAYLLAGVRNLFTLRRAALRLVLDGEQHLASAHSVFSANIGQVGDSAVIGSEIDPDDGRLDVGVVTQAMPWDALVTAVGMVLFDRDRHPDVEWHRCRHVRVEAEPPLPVQVDGEQAGTTPFEIEVLPSAVRVLVPR